VHRPNLWPLVDSSRGELGADLFSELLGDHPIESDHEYVVTASVDAAWMEKPQYTAHQTKGLACARSRLRADKRGADCDEDWNFVTPNAS
jgi:hypothetical protein